MLELLRIHNLALIENIEMEFAPGLNVLTGETGAGKSFIMKALNFLTGEKLGTDLVRPGKDKAVVEALFIVNGEERILRRELMGESGRSRLYLNDQLCSQETVKEMRGALLLHTSQHGQQKLLQPAFQAGMLDAFMQEPALIQKKDSLFAELSKTIACRERLLLTVKETEAKRDVLEHQQQEIDKVAPKPGEEEALEAERIAFRNQAGIADAVRQALDALRGSEQGAGVFTSFVLLERAIQGLAPLLEDFTTAPDTLAEFRLFLQELETRLRRASSKQGKDLDINAVESRLYALAQLKRKLKRSLASILALQEEITQALSFLDTAQMECSLLERKEQELCDALALSLAALNQARQKAALVLAASLREELALLGFSDAVQVIFAFAPHPLYPGRADCVEQKPRLLWQPNPGQAPQPLERIASGGELSRFLLAVVSLMSRMTEEHPTLIFDEVDAGVGGLTLNRVADRLAALAESHQLLLITHWPQLAARAGRHFVITKQVAEGQTYTRCERLAPQDISTELSRMTGG